MILFSTLFIGSYIAIFTVFNKDFNLKAAILEFLPVVSMTLSTIAFRIGDAKITRRFGFITQPLWLVYNIFNFAIGAIICEVLSIGSIIIGVIRYDIKKD